MRIGFDGKRAVQNFTGLGNYSRYIVASLVGSEMCIRDSSMPILSGE